MSSQSVDDSEAQGKEVIEWSENVEDHTLAVLEGDLEEDPDADVELSDLDGREGVAKANTERYVTDFQEEFEFRGSTVYLNVERSDGLNTVEYWSDDPGVLDDFDEFLEQRVRDVEQQPYLEPYKFENVPSDEIAELVTVYRDEFDLEGPLPRGRNGQPRMHMQRVTDIRDTSEYRKDSNEDEKGLNAQHRIPGDAKYVIEGVENGDKQVEGKLVIRPQKHDLGLYTVKFDGENAESQAYMVNTGLKAIDPDERDSFPI